MLKHPCALCRRLYLLKSRVGQKTSEIQRPALSWQYTCCLPPGPRPRFGVGSSIIDLHAQGVTEDTPLWDEDDALEEAEEAASAKAKPAAKKAAKKPAAKAADSGVVPKVKKAVVKAAKDSVAAAKVGPADKGEQLC